MKSIFATAALVACLIHPSLNAQQAAEKLVPTPWPAAPRPAVAVKDSMRQEDGFREVFTLIDCGGFGLEIENKGSWQLSSPVGRFSSLLNRRDTASYQFGISLFKPTEFLQSLEVSEWAKYLAHLQNSALPVSIILESSNIEQETMPSIFGLKYRQIVYQSALPDGAMIKTRELFAFNKGKLIVFTFRGTPAEVDRFWRESDMLLTRMNPAPGNT